MKERWIPLYNDSKAVVFVKVTINCEISEKVEDLYNYGKIYGDYNSFFYDPFTSVEYYKRAADLGDINSQYIIGMYLLHGKWMKKDLESGIQYLQNASDREHPAAYYDLGLCYELGNGVKQCIAKAVNLYLSSMKHNYTPAIVKLCRLYHVGKGVELNLEKSFHLAQTAAELGDIDGKAFLGKIYEKGSNGSSLVDEKKALELYTESAAANSRYGLVFLGDCYAFGRIVKKDELKAREFYERASILGYREAYSVIGSGYRYGEGGYPQDTERSITFLKLGAELDCKWGLCYLGSCYEEGYGVPQDYVKAAVYYTKSADLYYNAAQANLGQLYENGLGVIKDTVKAREYYQQAARTGSKFSRYRLGLCYLNGIGGEKDFFEAMYNFEIGANGKHKHSTREYYICEKTFSRNISSLWDELNHSAENGSSYAKYQLGVCYMEGKNTEPDYEKGVKLFREAIEGGYKLAETALNRYRLQWVTKTKKSASSSSFTM